MTAFGCDRSARGRGSYSVDQGVGVAGFGGVSPPVLRPLEWDAWLNPRLRHQTFQHFPSFVASFTP